MMAILALLFGCLIATNDNSNEGSIDSRLHRVAEQVPKMTESWKDLFSVIKCEHDEFALVVTEEFSYTESAVTLDCIKKEKMVKFLEKHKDDPDKKKLYMDYMLSLFYPRSFAQDSLSGLKRPWTFLCWDANYVGFQLEKAEDFNKISYYIILHTVKKNDEIYWYIWDWNDEKGFRILAEDKIPKAEICRYFPEVWQEERDAMMFLNSFNNFVKTILEAEEHSISNVYEIHVWEWWNEVTSLYQPAYERKWSRKDCIEKIDGLDVQVNSATEKRAQKKRGIIADALEHQGENVNVNPWYEDYRIGIVIVSIVVVLLIAYCLKKADRSSSITPDKKSQ